jgi:lipopolysaccharide/colanic/teichoic acid biosynthesis glycosyltransferase
MSVARRPVGLRSRANAPTRFAARCSAIGGTKQLRAVNTSGMRVVPETAAAGRTRHIVLKHILDCLLAISGLILLAPLLLLIAAVILVTSGRPIMFCQQRVGRGGARFRLYKFRTLDRSAAARGDEEWAVDAPTPLSAFLRFTGFDELPQLFNVLRGDMSLVGPRPERPYFVACFERELPGYAKRHRLRPGITGWAQVNGWRGNTSIARRLEHDLYYLDHRSLAFDLRILAATFTGLARGLWQQLRKAETFRKSPRVASHG